jgi:hypothetical protein
VPEHGIGCLKFETGPSSSAKADDPVFRSVSDEIEKPRRTGYPACEPVKEIGGRAEHVIHFGDGTEVIR